MRTPARKRLDLTTFDGRIQKQGYHKVGAHSAAKACKYAKDSLMGIGACYKNKFYGIASHRCLQCSPVLQFCNLSCRFCWRLMPETKSGWLKMPPNFEWDEPTFIADGLIMEQKRIMSGFAGNEKVDKKKAQEALEPKQVALSLIGEPMMYPQMSKLLAEFHSRKMTTFLVTNGTYPNALRALTTLPAQLYLSMVAPDEENYVRVVGVTPSAAKAFWKNYLESLDFLAEAGEKTRTVLRMTIARDLNDSNLDGYAALISRGKPHYTEVKSMVYVGWARREERGLALGDMLKMEEIEKIAAELSAKTGYLVVDKHVPSRVVLLARDEKAAKMRMISS